MNQISVEEAYKTLKDSKKALFLDVRTEGEFKRGHIENALHISLDQLDKNIEEEVPDKNIPIYVYCFSGSRSILAGETLENLGYQNVYNMQNGVLAWRSKGYPLV